MGFLKWLNGLRQYRPPWSRHTPSMALLLGLAIAGYLGNYFHVPLFFGIDLLFGSIFTLLILQIFGRRWGLLATAIASLHTYFLWGHPYAILIFLLEAVWVGWGPKRFNKNLVLLDITFWLLIAPPVVWVIYRYNVIGSDITALVILLKQSINGIFNALIATYLLTLIPPQWMPGDARPDTTLRQVLFNLLLAFLFFPTLTVTLIDGQQTFHKLQTEIQQHLTITERSLKAGLHQWYQDHVRILSALEQQLDKLPELSAASAQRLVDAAQQSMGDVQGILLVNPQGIILLQSSSTLDSLMPAPPLNTPYPNDWQQWPKHHRVDLTGLNLHTLPIFQRLSPDLIFPLMGNGEHRGWIVSTLSTARLNQLFADHTPDDSIDVMLLDQQQRLLAGSMVDRALLGTTPEIPPGIEVVGTDRAQRYRWFVQDPNDPALRLWQRSQSQPRSCVVVLP